MPPLEEQTVEVPFIGGLKEGEEPLLQTEGWQQIENCIRTKDGGFRKVRGFDPLGTGFDTNALSTAQSCIDVPSAARTLTNPRVIPVGESIAYVSNGTLYRNAANASFPRLPVATVSPWVAELSTIRALNGGERFDVCRANTVVYYVTVNTISGSPQRIVVTSHRDDTGELVHESTITASGLVNGVRVIPWGDTSFSSSALLVYREGTSIKWLLLTNGQIGGSSGTLAAGVPAGTPFDIYIDPLSHVLYTAIATSTTVVTLGRWNAASTSTLTLIGSSVTRAYGDPITAIALTYNSDLDRLLLCVADWFINRNRVTAVVLSGATLLQLNPQILVKDSGVAALPNTSVYDACVKQIACTVIGTNNLWYVCASFPNQANRGGSTNSVQFTVGVRVAADGTSTSDDDFIYNARMCSRLYVDNASQRVYFLAHLTRNGGLGTDPNSGVVIVGHPGLNTNSTAPYGSRRLIPFGFLAYGTAQVYGPEAGLGSGYFEQLSTPYLDANGALNFSWRDEENGVVRIRGVALVADARVGVHVQFGAQAYIAGAMLYQWDGYRAFEANFLQIPYIAGPAYTAAGGLTPGTRYYKATYLRVSKTGEQTRSRPSDSVAFTNGVGNINVVQINRINVTAAQATGEFEEIYYEVWRTKAGTTSPFFLMTRVAASKFDTALGPSSYALAIGEHVTINDQTEDANLRAVALAQDGSHNGELANDPPPSAAHICSWAGRLWLTDGEQIWYSKERATDRSAEFSFPLSFGRGALEDRMVALARCGETLAVFTAKETGYVYGSPAAANGEGASLVGPVLAQNIGCLHPAAVCNIPQGALVPTQYGVQLFTLNREYQPVGVDAEESLHLSGSTLTSAVYDQTDDLVWFCAGDRFVLLDVGRLQWSTAFTGSNPVSVAFAGDRLIMSTPSLIRERDVSAYLFQGSPYAQQIETPWFKAGGAIGEMRIRKLWLIAQSYGDSGLRVEVAYNYNSTWTDSVTFQPADIPALEGAPATIVRIALPRQRCRSFKLRFTETANGASESEGFGFLALRLAFANRGVRGAPLKEANSGGGF